MNVYGVVDGITYPLMFKIYKPKSRLKANDEYQSKPQLAVQLVQEIQSLGFVIERVLADSLYGESGAVMQHIREVAIAVHCSDSLESWCADGEGSTGALQPLACL